MGFNQHGEVEWNKGQSNLAAMLKWIEPVTGRWVVGEHGGQSTS